MRKSADHEAFLTQFSGDDRAVADYLVGEILSALPADLQDFLRVTSICDPCPPDSPRNSPDGTRQAVCSTNSSIEPRS
jgi:hypothetical protein